MPIRSEIRPRRRSASTSAVRVPARASVAARPKATVVFPWLPSGLVTTSDRTVPSEKSKFVRRSRSASAKPRNAGSVASCSGACRRTTVVSRGISANVGTPAMRPRSSDDSTFVVRVSLNKAAPIPRAAPSRAATMSVRRVRGKTALDGRFARSSSSSRRLLTPIRPLFVRWRSASVTACTVSRARTLSVLRDLIFIRPVPLKVSTVTSASGRPSCSEAKPFVVREPAASA